MTKEEEIKYLKELIEKSKIDLMNNKVQEWIYSREVADPKHMSHEKALETLGTYQHRIKFIEEFIEIYKLYAKDHEIDI